jgi:hypothetical protein
MTEPQKHYKIAGFDMGRQYLAWAVVRGNQTDGFQLYRHGFLFPPTDVKPFGSYLPLYSWFSQAFIQKDLMVSMIVAERFTYRPGSTGQGAEDINLLLGGLLLADVRVNLVRNTDWKSWFKRSFSKESQEYFQTPTPHEGDAAGLALYGASVLWSRR